MRVSHSEYGKENFEEASLVTQPRNRQHFELSQFCKSSRGAFEKATFFDLGDDRHSGLAFAYRKHSLTYDEAWRSFARFTTYPVDEDELMLRSR